QGEMPILRAIGLMSGTSLDGIDVALIETDGDSLVRFGATGYRPYAEAERAVLRQALGEAVHLSDRSARPGVLGSAEALVTPLRSWQGGRAGHAPAWRGGHRPAADQWDRA